MSMKHTYDWKLTPPLASEGSGLTAQTTMLDPESGKVFFDAKVTLKRYLLGSGGRERAADRERDGGGVGERERGGYTHVMHAYSSSMTVDPRILTVPGRRGGRA